MTAAYRTAYIYVRNVFAGELCESEEGYSFAYSHEYIASPDASAVSLTLPIRAEKYTSKVIFPFFDGLIPEGWMLDVVSRNWKFDRTDRFGLLLFTCQDSIGNVSIREVRV